MKKYNLKKIMTDAHILFRALKERGISAYYNQNSTGLYGAHYVGD